MPRLSRSRCRSPARGSNSVRSCGAGLGRSGCRSRADFETPVIQLSPRLNGYCVLVSERQGTLWQENDSTI